MKKKKFKLPACFQDFFKFRHECDDMQPASGLMYDNVQGMSRDLVAQLIDGGKYCNEQEATDNNLIAALSQVDNMLMGELASANIVLNREVEKVNACSRSAARACSTPGWRGQQVSTGHMHSAFSCLRVHHVIPYTVGNAVITLQIRGENNQLLYNKTHQVLPNGGTAIEINQDFNSKVLLIGFNQSNVQVYETECRRSGPCCVSAKTHKKTRLNVTGWDASYASQAAATAQGFGVTSCVSLVCKKDNLLCYFKDQLKNVILYMWAINVLQEVKFARRMNKTINIVDDQSDEMALFYNDMAHQSLQSALAQIKHELLKDKVCFGCCDVPIGYVAATS